MANYPNPRVQKQMHQLQNAFPAAPGLSVLYNPDCARQGDIEVNLSNRCDHRPGVSDRKG